MMDTSKDISAQETYYNGNNQSIGSNAMINDKVKAAEQNMERMIGNLANQVEADTGMAVGLITVDRQWVKTDNSCGRFFKVSISLKVKE